jgi:hypothetical protein
MQFNLKAAATLAALLLIFAIVGEGDYQDALDRQARVQEMAR